MAPHRKSPVHDSAAMLSQVHPSQAVWVLFEKQRSGDYRIENIGQFTSEFSPDWHGQYFRARFLEAYSSEYRGRCSWAYTLSQLGLAPVKRRHWYTTIKTDDELRRNDEFRDRRDPYTVWDNRFLVKIQNAHKVLGCTPQEFRDGALAQYIQGIAWASDILFQQEEEDARYYATEDAAYAEIE